MRAVITFHAIDEGASPLSFPPRLFRCLLDSLRQAQIPILPLEQLLATRDGHGVALTFDDGMASVFTAARPILAEHAAPATLFLTTGAVGGDNRWPGQPAAAPCFPMLSWAQVEGLHAAGVGVEAHTVRHPDLRRLDDAQIEAELGQADATIAARLGRQPRFLAYPYGLHDARVRALAARRYAGCLTTELRCLDAATEPAAIPRLDSHYLRHPAVMRHLAGTPVAAYLGLRRLIRRLRGRA